MPEDRGNRVLMGTTDEKMLVVRRNELIHARYRMKLQEQRLLLWLIAQVKREDAQLSVYRIGVKELAEFIGIEKNKNVYTELAGYTKSLMSRVAEICRVGEKTLTQVQFVSKTKYHFGDGVVELCLNEHMRPYVLELKERFTEIELGYAIRLASFYAIRIYEILKSEQYKAGGFTMSLSEFRSELGIEKGKLERINNFKAKVMDIAEREINGRTDLNFTYEWVKSGRYVVGIKFAMHVVRERDRRKIIKTLPGTSLDQLRQRLEDHGMPRAEAIRVVSKWGADPQRIAWHVDEVERLQRASKVQKPLAWLRAGLKVDYRPQGSLSFEERKAEAAELKRDAELRSSKRQGEVQSIGDALVKLTADLRARSDQRAV